MRSRCLTLTLTLALTLSMIEVRSSSGPRTTEEDLRDHGLEEEELLHDDDEDDHDEATEVAPSGRTRTRTQWPELSCPSPLQPPNPD